MKEFYIYLDIDGVLNSNDWVKKFRDFEFAKKHNRTYDVRAIQILNNLMTELEKKGFAVNLVISSSLRSRLDEVKKDLFKNGLKHPNTISRTGVDKDFHRGKEIKEYVEALGLTENEFVIIDDEIQDIKECFKQKNIIKTSELFGLTQKEVDNFLSNFFKKETIKER